MASFDQPVLLSEPDDDPERATVLLMGLRRLVRLYIETIVIIGTDYTNMEES